MEYIYAALLVHSAGNTVDEESVKAVLSAAGIAVDDSRVKALIAALEGVDIEEAISKAAAAPRKSLQQMHRQLKKKQKVKKKQHRQKRRTRKRKKRTPWQALAHSSDKSLSTLLFAQMPATDESLLES